MSRHKCHKPAHFLKYILAVGSPSPLFVQQWKVQSEYIPRSQFSFSPHVTPIFCNHKIWMQTICVEHIEQIVKEKYHTQCLITIANHSSLHKYSVLLKVIVVVIAICTHLGFLSNSEK
jgi:Rieske Fe-S protein